ncbi:hypothetical protein FM996_02135 [Methylosinus sporium]|uniref:Uncharacterized protein n=1 Tax=Methylosinus sporium TaxID=428 RepID=A0A549T6T3_METSR|nr:hypothetical protein [Methylosinus sporium]TRL37581.1 hypothetical protein FM996_02135 [Methylosinus sporium]
MTASSDDNEKRPKRLGLFRIVEDDKERKNPQSLRRVLYDILMSEPYNGDLEIAAQDLRKAAKIRKNRDLKTKISQNILYDIANDRIHIKYGHLDAFAQKMFIPAGLLLVYSRIIANQSSGKRGETLKIIKAMIIILSDIDKTLHNNPDYEFGHADLKKWAGIFNDVVNDGQIDLDFFT